MVGQVRLRYLRWRSPSRVPPSHRRARRRLRAQFEVISVDGNELVFRDERGTNQITVPDGFRFTVDGKQLAISDLKRGMKGTAVVTTTTTVTPVTLTEIKKGVVVGVGPDSLTVKDEADGVRKRFTQAQLNDRGIKIITRTGA